MSTTYPDITQYIHKENIRALNIDSKYPISNLFFSDSFVQSSDDEQLLIHIPFSTPVSIWSVSFDFISDETHPTCIKLFVNKPNITFIDVDDIKPADTFKIPEMDDSDPIPMHSEYKVKFCNFQKVDSLTVYIEDNNGADITQISSIDFKGKALSKMDLKNLKKC